MEMRGADPKFNLDHVGRQENIKEFKNFFMNLVFVNILLATVCMAMISDTREFFDRWWPYAAVVFIIMTLRHALFYQKKRKRLMRQKQEIKRYLHLDIKKKK